MKSLLDPFMIHESFPKSTETVFGGHPRCVVSIKLGDTRSFHGAAGNHYCNHARQVARITSLIRIEIANCPPYFLVRLSTAVHIGLRILHTKLLTLLILHAQDGCRAHCGIGQRQIKVACLCWTRIAGGTRSASRLLRSLSRRHSYGGNGGWTYRLRPAFPARIVPWQILCI
jgi:hypothetical protein